MGTEEAGWVWFFAVPVGTFLLGCLLVYGVMRNRGVRKDENFARMQDEGTRRARQETERTSRG